MSFRAGNEGRRRRLRWRWVLPLAAAAVGAGLAAWPAGGQRQAAPESALTRQATPEPGLPPALVRQIEAAMTEKAQRTPAQRKVSSQLLHAARIARGDELAGGAAARLTAVEVAADGTVAVDVRADVTPDLLARIDALGGTVLNSVPRYRAVRARLPLAAVEALAGLDDVQALRPADEAFTRGQGASALRAAAAAAAAADPAVGRKVNTSEGDAAHRADQARRRYGVDGAGIGIGVLSDGVDGLADRQASGDLPPTVTVLPGQARPAEAAATAVHNEGTALLEIVHDLAPGADLYFATALGGQAQFAANIEALCAAGADVIVDDIVYFREAPFQDDVVAQGINAAVAAGCIYFSAGGNGGNLNDGTSGVWEGDFNAAFPFTLDGKVVGISHRFNARGANVNRITGYRFDPICLKWSDPLGASANDYDLYLFDPVEAIILTSVSGTDTQDGTQDPVDCIPRVFIRATGEPVDLTRYRLVVVKAAGEGRFLHLNTHGGRLTFVTDGQMYDHAAAANAIGVGATNVAAAAGAGGVFDGTESVEWYSSDGPRRVFYRPDGAAITPGNFSATGGLLLRKPDVTAAARVSTATPGLEIFPGTSAAAPHAAAIAALMLQAAGGPRSLTRAQLLRAMRDTALDIEAPGAWDRDSGAGIVDAVRAVGAARILLTGPTRGGGAGTVHLTELRDRIDAARRACGLGGVSWTEPHVVSGVTPIRAVHVTQPRAALAEAYGACGRTPPPWTDPDLGPGTPVKALHFAELGDAAQALGGP